MRSGPAILVSAGLAWASAALAADARGGDLRRGERAFQKCYSCHAIEPGPALEGPSLGGIVGRSVAAEPGFDYSAAMRSFAAKGKRRWTADLLDRFIADPERLVPRTRMNFNGIADPRERADLILYLRQNRRH